MECPKCHSIIDDNAVTCPYCHKVFLLECPNCHSLGDSAICQKCGYTILSKCSKCSRINPTSHVNCSKCGFPINSSIAYQECETDEYASIIIKFNALKTIKKLLKSQELYAKFHAKLKNLLLLQIKNLDGKVIFYDDVCVVNFNKELSFATSCNKAIRFGLKLINAFVKLNSNIITDFSTPLKLNLTLVKKTPEELQNLPKFESDIKMLSIGKKKSKYLNGFQFALDQYAYDQVHKDYKTDSLYSIEQDGKTITFYEVVLNGYILPPDEKTDEKNIKAELQKVHKNAKEIDEKDLYSFKVFDINAKCTFENVSTSYWKERFDNIDYNSKKIISIRSSQDNLITTSEIAEHFEKLNKKVLQVSCSDQMTYKPWGFFETLFKDYFNLPVHCSASDISKLNTTDFNIHKPLFDFILKHSVKAMTPEDARFNYMEMYGHFLSRLKNTVLIIDGFENLDDTSIQTLNLYFDKFKNIQPIFVFITSMETTVHSKIKGLLRTPTYTEITLRNSTADSLLSNLKIDATDFIQSFYYEKFAENFNGSYLYFKHTLEYLIESGVLANFDSKLLIKNNKSVVLPKDLKTLIKARIKTLNKYPDASLILAFSTILGARIDYSTLQFLGINDVEKNAKLLFDKGFARLSNNVVYINNYDLMCKSMSLTLKKEAEKFLAKKVLTQLGKSTDDSILFKAMDILGAYKEEYLALWKNSQFAIKTGDYDAYLKNCLGFLSLVDNIDMNIPREALDENKKDVYNNILLCLYSYSPTKIYFIENILLIDAIDAGDDEKVVKLSNLMLQGALISSNYSDALGLLHNILSRMPNATLVSAGKINSKFLLLSLVYMEILYNIGNFSQCVEIANNILDIITPETLEKVRPASFSANLFMTHFMDIFRLAALSKVYLLQDDLDAFFEKIEYKLNFELPEKDCILAISKFFASEEYLPSDMENTSAYSKIIFLILQEIKNLKDDYKKFAQNIYQGKLLALEINQRELELFCDLLIAYAYSKIGIIDKAESIYKDIINISEKSAIFNILTLAKYFFAQQLYQNKHPEEALRLVNNALSYIQKFNNQSKVLYVIFEKLYIDIVKQQNISSIDVETEELKLTPYKEQMSVVLS